MTAALALNSMAIHDTGLAPSDPGDLRHNSARAVLTDLSPEGKGKRTVREQMQKREKMVSDQEKADRLNQLNLAWENVVEMLRANGDKTTAENRAKYHEYLKYLQGRKHDILALLLSPSADYKPTEDASTAGEPQNEPRPLP